MLKHDLTEISFVLSFFKNFKFLQSDGNKDKVSKKM